MECIQFSYMLRGTEEEINSAIEDTKNQKKAALVQRYISKSGEHVAEFIGNMPPYVPFVVATGVTK